MNYNCSILQITWLFFYAYDQVFKSKPYKNLKQLNNGLSFAFEGWFFLRLLVFLDYV